MTEVAAAALREGLWRRAGVYDAGRGKQVLCSFCGPPERRAARFAFKGLVRWRSAAMGGAGDWEGSSRRSVMTRGPKRAGPAGRSDRRSPRIGTLAIDAVGIPSSSHRPGGASARSRHDV
jgi:hypothetical protein